MSTRNHSTLFLSTSHHLWERVSRLRLPPDCDIDLQKSIDLSGAESKRFLDFPRLSSTMKPFRAQIGSLPRELSGTLAPRRTETRLENDAPPPRYFVIPGDDAASEFSADHKASSQTQRVQFRINFGLGGESLWPNRRFGNRVWQ